MTEYLSAARDIVGLSREKDSWDFIRDAKHGTFIWTDDDTVRQWNEIAARTQLPQVDDRVETSGKDEREFLTYKGRTVEVPLTHSRDDREVIIHTLGRLVMADSDIRFCLDSYHSSDLAFLCASTGRLEGARTGVRRERHRPPFSCLSGELEEFLAQAFSEENNREYEGAKPQSWLAAEQMARELVAEVQSLAKAHCRAVEVEYEMDLGVAETLNLCIKTKTDAERDSLSKDGKRLKQIVDIAKKRCAEHKVVLTLIHAQSQESVARDWAGDWKWGAIAGYSIYR
jgi:hypothetical protein